MLEGPLIRPLIIVTQGLALPDMPAVVPDLTENEVRAFASNYANQWNRRDALEAGVLFGTELFCTRWELAPLLEFPNYQGRGGRRSPLPPAYEPRDRWAYDDPQVLLWHEHVLDRDDLPVAARGTGNGSLGTG